MKSLAALALVAVATSAKPVPTAVPTGKWVVDFDDNYCLASRNFTADGKEVAFGLQPRPTTKGARAFIQTPRRLKSWDWEKAEITIGSETTKVDRLLAEPVVKPGYARYIHHLDEERLVKLEQAQGVTIDGENVELHFPLTGLASVRKVLDDCMAGLLESWGFSRETQATLVSFPKPRHLTSFFSADDYPARAVSSGAIGYVDVLLTVGTDGKVSECRVIRSSGHKELDDATCLKLRQRASFEPARDREGKAVASPYVTSIQWHVE